MARALQDPRLRPVGSTGGRIPPHDLDAEESLLGAMLLSRDAIAGALECCTAADFYKPAHGHIFGAITALYTRGEPADPVTVADELRRSGLLESVGDPSVLISLQVNTPSTANATHYARIVEEHALLRGLVTVAGEIAELGYSVPEDVTDVIDRAESMVFEVAQRRVVDTMSPLRDLLAQSLDHLEHLYARGDTITGVPTGYTDLDERLAGLQKSNLVVVGARPAMGKALALDTPVPTPAGWTTMGELEAGDEVFDETGRPNRVTYGSPVFLGHRCYRVAFDDGTEVVADAGHRWLAYDLAAWQARRSASAASQDGSTATPRPGTWQAQPRVVTTEEMVAAGIRTPAGRPNWYVPVAEPLEGPEAELPVDPYRLGRHLAEAVLADQPARLPDRYLRAAFKARLDVLAGFLDTLGAARAPDVGTVERQGARTELRLADRFVLVQLRELLCSLGIAPSALGRRSVRSAGGHRAQQWVVHWWSPDTAPRPGTPGRAAAAAALSRYGRRRRHAVVAIEEVPSVPVRCIAVDSPSRLFLAGPSMVPTHNTSFALGIVANAAVHARVPVLLFSLEMSHLELTQRLLCSEARVDATRMRNGRLLEADWPKISDAIGRLGDAPIYIDDNPNVTVMDIRAKARRLKAREGLGLVVVDYLQLMSGHSRSRAENRQVEVSEISRGLKVLARELDIPVVALSQLSRNLEMRQDKRPVLADLRESGCLTADTRIMRSDTGAEATMGELLESGERGIPVWAVDEHLRMVPATMTHVFASGVKRTYELRLASGRRVRGSGNHPFRTVLGWQRLDQLVVGDRLATPRVAPEPTGAGTWPEPEVIMLAHMLGDGCFASGQPVHYTSADEANLKAVENAATHFGITPRRVARESWTHVYLPSPYRLGRGRRNPIVEWLDGLGLRGLRSHEKSVPDAVFGLSNAQLALFLRHLWATDGCLWWKGTGPVRCYYASSSRRFVDGVQALLLRFGIVGRIRESTKSGYGPMFHVHITGATNQLEFLDKIGVHGARGESTEVIRTYLGSLSPNTNVDVVPREIWGQIKEHMRDAGISQRGLSVAMGWAYCGSARYRDNPTRAAVGALATALEAPALRDLSESDVFWDEIVAIDDTGEQPVFDATVLEHHNFVANGIVAHNSIEQDSDVVMFIYRDEIYNPDSQDRGTAEIIIAKHRNGPTGVTQLAFMDHHTRFANMARV